MKKILIPFVIIASGLLLPPFVVPLFEPWSAINCRDIDINIKTGQARYSRMFWFMEVSERVEDTPLSLALEGDAIDVANVEPWHSICTFSPGLRNSPHYAFHGALSQARLFAEIASERKFTPERKKEIAVKILTSWQKTGGDAEAGELLLKLMEE